MHCENVSNAAVKNMSNDVSLSTVIIAVNELYKMECRKTPRLSVVTGISAKSLMTFQTDKIANGKSHKL